MNEEILDDPSLVPVAAAESTQTVSKPDETVIKDTVQLNTSTNVQQIIIGSNNKNDNEPMEGCTEMKNTNESLKERNVSTNIPISVSTNSAQDSISKDNQKRLIAKHNLSKEKQNNYGRGCIFSPDGLCILSYSEDNKIRLFEPPQESSSAQKIDIDEQNPSWDAVVTIPISGPIYDVNWYPLTDSNDPDTCCLAVTSQYQPVHLYDAYDGHLRATYRCYDHVDEVVAARSLAFDPTGQKLYVGLKNEICIFDVAIPGRKCAKRKTFTAKDGGLTGIISSIAVNPAMPSIYAVGTYSRGLAVYLEPQPHTLCYLDGQKGGITYIKFSPDGTKLLAGGRKDDEILVWDMRNPGQLYAVLKREVETNQRIYFDIDHTNRYVISGATSGKLRVWDIKQSTIGDGECTNILPPIFNADTWHSDCINGVNFHPKCSKIVATCSGQRHHFLNLSSWGVSSDEENEKQQSLYTDNSLKLWQLGLN